MTERKQKLKHYSKIPHKTRNNAMIAVKKLEKKGILTRTYKKYGRWFLTERYKGARVLRILEELKREDK